MHHFIFYDILTTCIKTICRESNGVVPCDLYNTDCIRRLNRYLFFHIELWPKCFRFCVFSWIKKKKKIYCRIYWEKKDSAFAKAIIKLINRSVIPDCGRAFFFCVLQRSLRRE